MLQQTITHLQDENAALRKSLEEQREKTLAAVLNVQHVQDEFAHFKLAADDEMTRLWSLLLKVESSKALLPLLQDCSGEVHAQLLDSREQDTTDEEAYDPPGSPRSERSGGSAGSPRSVLSGGLAGTLRIDGSEEPQRIQASGPFAKEKVLAHAGSNLSQVPTTMSRQTSPASARRTPAPRGTPLRTASKKKARARKHPPSVSPRRASPSSSAISAPRNLQVRLLDIQRRVPDFLVNRSTFSTRVHFKESTSRSASPSTTKRKRGTKRPGVRTAVGAHRSRGRKMNDATSCARCPKLLLELENMAHFEQAAKRLLKLSQDLQKDVRSLEEDRAKNIRNSMNLQKEFVGMFKGSPTARKSKVDKELLTNEITRLKTNLITDTSRAKELKLFEELLGEGHADSKI